MDINIQLPSDPAQRRRQQNRIAQRKFRQKREQRHQQQQQQQQQQEQDQQQQQQQQQHGNGTPIETSTMSSTLSSLFHQHMPILTPPSPQSFVPSDVSTSSSSTILNDETPGAAQTARGTGYHQSGSISLSDVDTTMNLGGGVLWDVAYMQDLLSHNPSHDSAASTTTDLVLPPPASDGTASTARTWLSPLSGPGDNSGTTTPLRQQPMHSIETITPPHQGSETPTPRLSSSLGVSTPESSDTRWQGALHIAAQKGHEGILRALLARNVDCNEKDSDGRTPLIYAVVQDYEAVALMLLGHGARLGEADRQQRMALHYAVLHQRENMLRIILQHYRNNPHALDVNAKDESGWTPLHIAVYKGFEAGVEMLLQYGADVHRKARFCPFTAEVIPHS